MTPFSPLIRATAPPPVMEARRWLQGVDFPDRRPLLNLSQAAPVDPPPEDLRAVMAEMIAEPDTHLYGPVLGLPALRSEIAWRSSALYGGEIRPDEVAVTAGCNQAFCAAMMTLAAPGDAVLLPVPVVLQPQDVARHDRHRGRSRSPAAPACSPTRTPPAPASPPAPAPSCSSPPTTPPAPNTPPPSSPSSPPSPATTAPPSSSTRPTATSPPATPARTTSSPTPPGATPSSSSTPSRSPSTSPATAPAPSIASAPRLAEAEKVLDTMTICAPQLGQKAALWGLRNLTDWVASERAEILRRRDAARTALSALPGWRILGCGAYFAYVEHPHPLPSNELAPLLVRDLSLLMLPGTMFAPEGDASRPAPAPHRLRQRERGGAADAGGEAGDAGGGGGLNSLKTIYEADVSEDIRGGKIEVLFRRERLWIHIQRRHR